jgi:hypothetical protein
LNTGGASIQRSGQFSKSFQTNNLERKAQFLTAARNAPISEAPFYHAGGSKNQWRFLAYAI